MSFQMKFKCPTCKGEKYEAAIVGGHKSGQRRCLGDIVGTQRERTAHGPMFDVTPCQFSWDITNDWKYFILEVSFSSDAAYQTALKFKQGANVLQFVKANLTSG